MGLLSSPIFSKSPTLTWEDLSLLNYETGDAPEQLSQFQNKTIDIAGFIVPLEIDELSDYVKDFLLVPDPLACIHVPPPPPNQIVYVNMNKKIPIDMDYRGVKITGKLTIFKTKDNYFSYNLVGITAEEADIEFDDPLEDYIDEYIQETYMPLNLK